MRGPKEKIRLDASLVGMIKASVFEAKLGNGHCLKVVTRDLTGLLVGDRVLIEMSPCAMAQGVIVSKLDSGGSVRDESQKFNQTDV